MECARSATSFAFETLGTIEGLALPDIEVGVPTILIVDDRPDNLSGAVGVMQDITHQENPQKFIRKGA